MPRIKRPRGFPRPYPFRSTFHRRMPSLSWNPEGIRPLPGSTIERRVADRHGIAGEFVSGGIMIMDAGGGPYTRAGDTIDVVMRGRVIGYSGLVSGETVTHLDHVLGVAIDDTTIRRD